MKSEMRAFLSSLCLLLLAASSAAADAPKLDDLRKDGIVGERFDGMAVVRSESAGADVRKVVDAINAKRSEIYGARAKTQGVAAVEVGKVYALEIMEKAPPSTWFLDAGGKWVQKAK